MTVELARRSREEANAAQSGASLGRLERRVARILLASAGPMMPRYPALPSEERRRIDTEMEIFLVRQIFSMPRYLFAPFLLALFTFDVLPILTSGRSFSDLAEPQRARVIASWARSRIAQKRDLIKLIRNCALYFYLDHPLVRSRLESASETPDGN